MSTQREEKSNDQHHTQNDTFTFAANHPDEVFALNPKPSRATTFENTAIKLVEIEKKSKRRWYPYVPVLPTPSVLTVLDGCCCR